MLITLHAAGLLLVDLLIQRGYTNNMNTINNDKFISYCLDFYGDESSIYKLGFTRRQLELATELYQLQLARDGEEFCGDTIDREHVAELILTFKDE